MGIPYYFSYLVKNNPEILIELKNLNKKINNFYLDCNSIIYDSVRLIEYTTDKEFEEDLLKLVCDKIEEYIKLIEPTNQVIIAFDGVAPVAKLNQQRNRRHKSSFEKQVFSSYKNTASWNTTSITPGTLFMKKLNTHIKKHFEKSNLCKNIKVYSSDVPGEGEHKLYEFIRNFPEKHKDEVTVVYGIDADLIMLSINHLPICNKIYLYRETPYFIKSINNTLEPNKCYIINIPKLANEIIYRMNDYKEANFIYEKNKLYDYIFLCFLLGNDFMPHSPCLNIRTNGMDIVLKIYSELFKNSEKNLTNGKEIYWKNVRLLFSEIAKNEEQYLKDEFVIRKKWEKRPTRNKTSEDKLEKMNLIPIKNRNTEKLINPNIIGWKKRYYKYLFDIEDVNSYIQKICVNYFEALEWTFKYYGDSCYDWRWCYHYNYAPLFSDLVKYIPYFNTEFIEKQEMNPISPELQLAYVLPEEYQYLINNDKIKENINKHKHLFYSKETKFHWEFCKYFWEGHLELPETNINLLEKLLTK